MLGGAGRGALVGVDVMVGANVTGTVGVGDCDSVLGGWTVAIGVGIAVAGTGLDVAVATG